MKRENRTAAAIKKLELLRERLGKKEKHPVYNREELQIRAEWDVPGIVNEFEQNGLEDAIGLIDDCIKDLNEDSKYYEKSVYGLEIMVKVLATAMLEHSEVFTATELESIERVRCALDPTDLVKDEELKRYCGWY